MTHPELIRRYLLERVAAGQLMGYRQYIFGMSEGEFAALCEQLIDDKKIHEQHFFGRSAWKTLRNALDEHREILIRLGALEAPKPSLRIIKK